MLKEALLYKRDEDSRVSCFLCSHRCRIQPGKFGICNVRENKAGVLFTHSYGRLIAENIDPIEKKPLYHFYPGSKSYSIAAIGCNFRCEFCQNWQISQVREAEKLGIYPRAAAPEEVARNARRSGSQSISYTYTEPTIFFEFAFDIARPARESGLGNVFVTNGFMTPEMLETMHPYLDAANVDLKSFDESYYRKICKGALAPVLKSIEKMKELGIWVEATTLLLPGLNDSEAELGKIAGFLAGVDKSIPWHISRFHPQYKMENLMSTPMESMERALEAGKKAGLKYIYLGNVSRGNNTYCYQCGKLLIERIHFSVLRNDVHEGRCPQCRSIIDGRGL